MENLVCANTSIISGSGDIDLGLPEGVGATLDIQTTSGYVTYSTQCKTADGLRIIGDGEYAVAVETVSGNLKVRHSQ